RRRGRGSRRGRCRGAAPGGSGSVGWGDFRGAGGWRCSAAPAGGLPRWPPAARGSRGRRCPGRGGRTGAPAVGGAAPPRRRRGGRSGVRDVWRGGGPRGEGGRELLWESTRWVREWLVDRLDPQPGQTILDLAAGTGETGFLAAPRLGPGGRLITSDLSPGMLEAAERVAVELGVTNAEFRVLDGERIELPDASVDGVGSRFGYVLRGEPPRALAEVRRVLRPGGRFAFAVWGAREQNRWMTVPAEVMVERGHLPRQSEGETRLSAKRNPAEIRRVLADAGFGEAEVEQLPVAYRFANRDELWFFASELRGPVALALAKLGEEERSAVRAEIERRADRVGDGYELSGVSINVATRRGA